MFVVYLLFINHRSSSTYLRDDEMMNENDDVYGNIYLFIIRL